MLNRFYTAAFLITNKKIFGQKMIKILVVTFNERALSGELAGWFSRLQLSQFLEILGQNDEIFRNVMKENGRVKIFNKCLRNASVWTSCVWLFNIKSPQKPDQGLGPVRVHSWSGRFQSGPVSYPWNFSQDRTWKNVTFCAF